ncbi:MAG TPA: hypothetical protein PKD11_06075 [Pyrinomonadaceae bacterium]|nr:hypothetical protein [Pyrinomonadaceae bacterium]
MRSRSNFLGALAFCCFAALSTSAQTTTDNSTERELARLAIEAHGGDKLREMKTLIVTGTVNVTAAQFPQALGGTFVTVFKGDKYRFELNSPLQAVKQVSDGRETSSSPQGGFTLPPVNRLGFLLLQRIGEPGFIVTALPEAKRKRKGFRVTSPEGFFTDFYLDDKTNQIRSFDSTYVVQGRTVTTSVELDRVKNVDGVLVPERYVQRFDMDQFTIYASFRAREIKVNTEVDDDVFSLGS